MKTYIFTVDKKQQRNGYIKYIAKIYRVKNNVPTFVTECSYNGGSYSGHRSEVFNVLMQVGEIPKKYEKLSRSEWRGGGFYCEAVEKKGIQIIQL